MTLTAADTIGYDGTNTNIAGGFQNINNLLGNTGVANSLQGPNTPNVWTITGVNAGNLNGTFSFAAIPNLVGGKRQ